eukprot:TRINITY_DN3434_c0_g2_i11.p1 TRINITY_DN3434_c0_g2~~TRINITY_DN3434_c0_g2_i11.p1  ORF type:complete len:344 (+),score=58.63 TRINITY_DN3434_c0_g2_i11:198-1229(+)
MKNKLSGYEFFELIGSGSFGKVYRGLNLSTKEPCAIKAIPNSKLTSRALTYLNREVSILQSLTHSNVLRLLAFVSTNHYKFLIFEYCNGGDLEKYQRLHGPLDDSQIRNIVSQLAKAVNALHTSGFIHRDIKPSNVLLHFPTATSRRNLRPVVKLGDFGLSRELSANGAVPVSEDALEMSYVGTPLNMAPEVHACQKYSFKADIWSLGTLVFELACGRPCFNGKTDNELRENIERGMYVIPKNSGVSKSCMDFIASCLVENCGNRIAWEQVMEHPFIMGESKDSPKLNKKSWRLEEEDAYIFSTKLVDCSEDDYKCNGCQIIFSYSDNAIDDENSIEDDFVLV